MATYPTNNHLYNSLWSKYRPVVVKLMVDSVNGPQQYQFLQHEFKDINPKEKGGYSFELHAHQARAINNIKMSVVAQNLLEILQNSGKAMELMYEAIYEITLDKQFMLQVTRVEKEEPTEEAPVEEVSMETTEDAVEEASADEAEAPAAEESGEEEAPAEPESEEEEKSEEA